MNKKEKLISLSVFMFVYPVILKFMILPKTYNSTIPFEIPRAIAFCGILIAGIIAILCLMKIIEKYD